MQVVIEGLQKANRLLNVSVNYLDPLRTSKGHLALKALRLTPQMMTMYRDGDFSSEKYVVGFFTHLCCVLLHLGLLC